MRTHVHVLATGVHFACARLARDILCISQMLNDDSLNFRNGPVSYIVRNGCLFYAAIIRRTFGYCAFFICLHGFRVVAQNQPTSNIMFTRCLERLFPLYTKFLFTVFFIYIRMHVMVHGDAFDDVRWSYYFLSPRVLFSFLFWFAASAVVRHQSILVVPTSITFAFKSRAYCVIRSQE